MSEDTLKSVRDLISDFGEMGLSSFRDAFHGLVKDKNPQVDRYLMEQLKNFRGNRGMRAEIASALAMREDESYVEDFAAVIEKETDVGLCKECILGLVKIGTQEAVQKLDFLAKNKPNATISSLLRQELDKLRHEEKEPVAYYLDHLAKGNHNARACIHAAKVLNKMGDAKVVDEILSKFSSYDDLARTEGAKVIARLGQPNHLKAVLDNLDRYSGTYKDNEAFLETADGFSQSPKEDRIKLLHGELKKTVTAEQEPLYEKFKAALESIDISGASAIRDQILEIAKPVGIEYYLESLVQIMDNKIAHANKYHEEALRAGRVRHSRLRHLVAELAYGIGKIGGARPEKDHERSRAISWLTELVRAQDTDVSKMALFGTSFIVEEEDEVLLEATLHSHQLEGMTRLLRTLERKTGSNFTEFFLNVAMNHEILDIQEMAMHALGNTPEVFDKVREMLSDDAPDTKRTAIRIIGEIKCMPFIDDMVALLEGQSDIIRIEAINSLGKMGDPSILPQINHVMYDAKSIVLIEACLKAMARVNHPDGIANLREYAEKTRNKKTAVIAIRLIVESYKSWNNALPDETTEIVLEHLKPWFEERDANIRKEAYQIASLMVTTDLEIYKILKTLFKDASSRLRSQAQWDKDEMALTEESLRTVNRNFFFLKEMLTYNDTLQGRCRNYDNPSSTTRIQVFEKIISLLEGNESYVISEENEKELEKVVFKGLELSSGSWREEGLCFKIAGYTNSQALVEDLSRRVKTVAKQAKADLMQALSQLGLGLAELKDLTSIKNIMVLEGSGFYRKRVVKYLQAQEYQVRDTNDLEMAYAMIKSEIPDLIVTEVTFSTPYEGAEFAEKLAAEYGGRLSFIFSTNNREASVAQRLVKLNPLGIFHKPYPLERLEEAIKA